MWVHMSLTRDGDAEYTFTTQILRCSNEELVLAHTNKINRVQQRNWLRVNVDIPVKATLLDASRMGDILSGKIIDLSGGGLGVMLPARLSSNSMILLNFELPGRGQIADFPVKVVRVAAQSDGNSSKTAHSVTFTG
jgi:c-di-GMP-binding flagellar brake protein YcgR